MSFRKSIAWLLGAVLLAQGCTSEEIELEPTPEAIASVQEIVTGISIRGANRRLEAARGDTRLPFRFRFSDGAGQNVRSCDETPELLSALSRLMSIPVVARATKAEKSTLAAVPPSAWFWVSVRNNIVDAGSAPLRVLPPTPSRPRAYAKAKGTKYFVTDSHLLDVLSLDCKSK